VYDAQNFARHGKIMSNILPSIEKGHRLFLACTI